MDIKKIKTGVGAYREEMLAYIKSAGTVRQIQNLTGENLSRISLILNRKLTPKIETLIDIVERIQENKK